MSDASIPQCVLVKSTNPYNDGRYGRRGLRFSRDGWRPLTIAEVEDLENSTISAETYKVLDKDPFLAVKPATEQEIADFAAEQAASGGDKDATIDALKAKNADLESRLLKLELAAQPPAGKAKDAPAKVDQPKG